MGMSVVAPDDFVKIPLGTAYECRPWEYVETGPPPERMPAASVPAPRQVSDEDRRILEAILKILLHVAQRPLLRPLARLELDGYLYQLLQGVSVLLKSVGEILMKYLASPEEAQKDVTTAYLDIQRRISQSVPSILDPASAVSLQAITHGYFEICLGTLANLPRLLTLPANPKAEEMNLHFAKLALSTTIGLTCVFGLLKDFERSTLEAIIEWGEDAIAPSLRLARDLGITDGTALETAIPDLRARAQEVLNLLSR